MGPQIAAYISCPVTAFKNVSHITFLSLMPKIEKKNIPDLLQYWVR
jgi:hypothetical protein